LALEESISTGFFSGNWILWCISQVSTSTHVVEMIAKAIYISKLRVKKREHGEAWVGLTDEKIYGRGDCPG
jgi:hypothetical protein